MGPCGFVVGCGELNEQWRTRRVLQQRREAAARAEQGGGRGQPETSSRAVNRYLEFLSEQQRELEHSRLTERDTAIELGRVALPHLDYTPLPDTSPPPEELAIELLYD
jgi:hypothetical protein